MNPTEYMNSWTESYIKYKDSIKKRLVRLDNKGDQIIANYKDKTILYYVYETLKDYRKSADESIIITLNTKENLQVLLQEWNDLVKKKLTVIFINPFSKIESKWAITPYIHDIVSEKASLKQGVESMFMTVGQIEKEKLKELSIAA